VNKRAEELLGNNLIARQILRDKKLYENQIAKQKKQQKEEEDVYRCGLSGGVQIGFNIAAYNCKRLLESILLREVR